MDTSPFDIIKKRHDLYAVDLVYIDEYNSLKHAYYIMASYLIDICSLHILNF